LLTSRDEECGFFSRKWRRAHKDPFEVVVWIYRRLQRRAARREIGPPTSAEILAKKRDNLLLN
jgi:hypothetical protein